MPRRQKGRPNDDKRKTLHACMAQEAGGEEELQHGIHGRAKAHFQTRDLNGWRADDVATLAVQLFKEMKQEGIRASAMETWLEQRVDRDASADVMCNADDTQDLEDVSFEAIFVQKQPDEVDAAASEAIIEHTEVIMDVIEDDENRPGWCETLDKRAEIEPKMRNDDEDVDEDAAPAELSRFVAWCDPGDDAVQQFFIGDEPEDTEVCECEVTEMKEPNFLQYYDPFLNENDELKIQGLTPDFDTFRGFLKDELYTCTSSVDDGLCTCTSAVGESNENVGWSGADQSTRHGKAMDFGELPRPPESHEQQKCKRKRRGRGRPPRQ